MTDLSRDPETTARKIARARQTLTTAGWTTLPPPAPHPTVSRDQCEYPAHHLHPPGPRDECCTNSARPKPRRTSEGTMLLCDDHYRAPESELFDGEMPE